MGRQSFGIQGALEAVDVDESSHARGPVWDLEMLSQIGPAVSRLLSRNHSCHGRQFLARQGCRTLQNGYLGWVLGGIQILQTEGDDDSAQGCSRLFVTSWKDA